MRVWVGLGSPDPKVRRSPCLTRTLSPALTLTPLWPEGLAEELQAQREEQEAAEEAGLERDPPDASRVSMWDAEHGTGEI